MLDRHRTVHVLLVVVLALTAVTAAAPAATAQSQPEERSARLAIEQPAYLDSGDVATTTANDTRVYTAKGAPIDIRPRNFNQSQVVDFGVSTPGGSLEYNTAMAEYEFTADATGTYTLFWLVSERQNGTVQQVRYVASIRIDGGLDQTHLAADSLDETRADAQKWREFNATVDELQERNLLLASADRTNQETIQDMVNAFILRYDPVAAFSGDFVAVGILLFSGLGGLLWVIFFKLPDTAALWYLKKKLNRYIEIENVEGELAERVEAIAKEEDSRTLQKMPVRKIVDDPHLATAFRDILGETPKEQFTELLTVIRPAELVRDRLEVMGANGYRAVVTGYTAADGGDGAEQVPASAEVIHEDDLTGDEDDVRDLAQISDPLLSAIDWDQDAIKHFDLSSATVDGEHLSERPATMDVTSLNQALDVELREFTTEEVPAQYLYDLVESVRENPLTDHEGTPDSTRLFLEELLRSSELLDDRYAFPAVSYLSDSLQRALTDHDPADEAGSTVDEIQDGSWRPGAGGESGAD